MVQHRDEARPRDHREGEDVGPEQTRKIIGLAMKIHRHLGPGLLESAYEECLCWELNRHGFSIQRQVKLPLVYEEVRLPVAYCADIVIDRSIVVEIKSIDMVLPVHKAQILTYLRLSGCRVGLLMNFNQALLKDGLHRVIL